MKGKYHNHNKGMIQQRERQLINQLCIDYIPNIYAAMMLAMYDELKLEHDDIERVVLRSQQIWDEYTRNGWNIKQSCYECTEIDVEHFKSAGNIVG